MSLSNLGHLLVVPFGCGEQNLVKATNNFVVANYRNSTGQLTKAIATRVKANIMKGEEWGMYGMEVSFVIQSYCVLHGVHYIYIFWFVCVRVHTVHSTYTHAVCLLVKINA